MVASIVRTPPKSVGDRSIGSLTDTPQFEFSKFFHGHTRASGWFCDRFGNARRHFCGDFYGYFDSDKFVLDEKLFYTDGVVEERVWTISIDDSGIFRAESESLVKGARGSIKRDTLTMEYSMKVKIDEGKVWSLDMKDSMILQPDGSLHNITQVYKWGIRIGSVSAQYFHHDGDNCCMAELA